MNIKPIKTQKDYQDALNRLEVIFDAVPGSPESDELAYSHRCFATGILI